MAAKYFVWGEGVWRELDAASGRVSGWRRRARFVFVRRGRLLLARRRPVLRALEALAAGQPSHAADGPRLSYRSKTESRTKRKHETPAVPAAPHVGPAPPAAPAACEHRHCCLHRCNDTNERPAAQRTTATQWPPSGAGPSALTFNVKQKHDPAAAAPHYSSAEEFVNTSAREPALAARNKAEVNELFGRTPATEPAAAAAAADKNRTPVAAHAADKSGDERRERARKRAGTVVSDSTSADELLQRSAAAARASPAACKELVISDVDVALLRGYVARTNASALQRFDVDDAYKRLLFYAINPLVQLERCARLECLLRTASLGLVPARPRARRSASADADKENKDRHSTRSKVREPGSASQQPAPPARATHLGVSERGNKLDQQVALIKAPSTDVASDPPRAKPERGKPQAELARASGDFKPSSTATHVISKRASRPSAKEYSNLEDHAIVAWLSAGSRASLVGGNRVWRELQEQFQRLTGRVRSWHSLRNRYLRYILPALGALQLPPADVSRLRAAAATGAIKTKSRASRRRHSAFPPPQPGASSRRPRPVSSSDEAAAATDDGTAGPSSPKRRSLRPRPPESASSGTSNKQAGGAEPAGRSPRYSEVTRAFAARRPASSSSAPQSPRTPSPVLAPSTRSRRLFNPNKLN